ncbi:MAG: helix-turn-helix domain-containing protein [Gloeobacterales cyanobacterium]
MPRHTDVKAKCDFNLELGKGTVMKPELTLVEVSAITGRSVRTIRRWIADGRLVTIARHEDDPPNSPTLIAQEELERFLDESNRIVRTHEPEWDEQLIEKVAARVVEHMRPVLHELRREMSSLASKEQLETLRREQESSRQMLPTTNSSPRSGWRRLLGVD